MVQIAKRMESFEGYLGTEMNIRLTRMKEAGRDVINLGLGDPDVIPPLHLLETLRDASFHPENHHYPSFYSIKPLKEVIARWYGRRFGVTLDPASEVLPLLGSSEGLFHIHLALLDAGGIQLAADDRAALERVEYAPCLAGLFWLDGQVRLPDPGAVQSPDSAVGWIADNQRKGISPEATVVTVHAGPELSHQLFEAPEREGLAALQAALHLYLDRKARIVQAQLKRWRYAMPTELYPERNLLARGLPTLVFAGDAFGGPRVEGAALSGLLAGQSIAEGLSIPSESEKIIP